MNTESSVNAETVSSTDWLEALTKSMESAALEKAKYEPGTRKWDMCYGAENALRILLEWHRRQCECASNAGICDRANND